MVVPLSSPWGGVKDASTVQAGYPDDRTRSIPTAALWLRLGARSTRLSSCIFPFRLK